MSTDDYTFWRIQDAGFPLSASHRSRTWGGDDDDEGEEHDGTSCVGALRQIETAGALLGLGEIEIVCFDGLEVGRGWDREPVVIPERELRRFRHAPVPGGRWQSVCRASTVEDLLRQGWVEVPALSVED